ncbi:Glycoside hydrolase, subgroup, catalytic core [Purpureocillium lavendulum]|uniref:Glycoside hydrolase, subgroup, catalytic core n=1 Tax=Purpureocillium lavendulum TaxID=1247861 RepID=A0AB34FE58_9HYPO|nr:Glycoside hydrolase, subgroup, catalytic core [Purpureocillium lavendulum]
MKNSFATLCALALAGCSVASPTIRRQASGAQNVVYWGQNGGGTVENNDLGAYCQAGQGIDVVVLAFLYQYGNGGNIPSGTIGQSCYISTSGEGQNCDNVTKSVAACQAAGVKIVLSLGGATSSYSLQSQEQAEQIGQYLWDSYGNSGNTSVARPFGDNHVNGWDFDIEVNGGSSKYYKYLIAKLRSNFASDSGNTYLITGAPQCPIPEPNMGEIIETSQFDEIYVQFYNNNNYTVPCALPINGNAPFNYNNWTAFISNTPSKNAKIFIGLASIINEYKSDAHFGGIMMWSAGFSDSNVTRLKLDARINTAHQFYSMSRSHPLEFHAPGWHDEGRTPVVDGKYYDRATGEVRLAADGDHQEYLGPPAVDIIVRSQHIDTVQCAYRAARAFPMEALLSHIMKVVKERRLELDSVMATTFSIRIILCHVLTPDEFNEIALDMANGLWDETDSHTRG